MQIYSKRAAESPYWNEYMETMPREKLVASLKLCMTHLPGLSGSFRLVQSTLSRTS